MATRPTILLLLSLPVPQPVVASILHSLPASDGEQAISGLWPLHRDDHTAEEQPDVASGRSVQNIALSGVGGASVVECHALVLPAPSSA